MIWLKSFKARDHVLSEEYFVKIQPCAYLLGGSWCVSSIPRAVFRVDRWLRGDIIFRQNCKHRFLYNYRESWEAEYRFKREINATKSLLRLFYCRDTSISATAEITSKYHFAAHMGQLISGVEGTGCHNFYPDCPLPGFRVSQLLKSVKFKWFEMIFVIYYTMFVIWKCICIKFFYAQTERLYY